MDTLPRMGRRAAARSLRALATLGLALLLTELLDEFVYGAREAAWPLIRGDLRLSYGQIGLALSLPDIIANFVEPALGILGDVWRRRALVLGGGVVYALGLLLFAGSPTFLVLLVAMTLLSPASGAFVGLAQSTLMDLDPTRHEPTMARWNFAGSAGAVAGPLALGALVALGLGWRGFFAGTVALTLLALGLTWRHRIANGPVDADAEGEAAPRGFGEGLRLALRALRRREVLRWLALLECSDLLLDVLLGYLALYMVDVAHATPAQGGLAVALWTGMGLLGSLLMIPLLARVPGLRYARLSAALELLLFPAFLLAPGYGLKLALLALVSLCNSGWYPVLKGQLYTAMPGQSGTVLTLGAVFGQLKALSPLALGLLAARIHLGPTMWLLLLGPAAILIGLPRRSTGQP